MIDYLYFFVISVGFAVVGMILHEVVHYVLGWLSGGDPFVSETWFYIPREIDYRKAGAMSNRQVRLTGGTVLIFPVTLFLIAMALALLLVFGFSISPSIFAGLWLIIMTCVGGAGISWLDILAYKQPEEWKSYTKGQPIQRGT